MLVVGLTGGIGSGKSTVAQLFSELQVPVIDADLIARQVTQPQTLALQQIVDYFGPSILKADQTLDREKLRQLVFDDPLKKKWLEELLHPLIIQDIKKQLQALKASYCLIVIPLLFETGPYSFIDRILVVHTPDETRLKRTQARDKTTAADLQKIMASQANTEESLAKAHDVIDNQGNLDELRQQVVRLHQQYLINQIHNH
jgi:dephospho-CoA kinase